MTQTYLCNGVSYTCHRQLNTTRSPGETPTLVCLANHPEDGNPVVVHVPNPKVGWESQLVLERTHTLLKSLRGHPAFPRLVGTIDGDTTPFPGYVREYLPGSPDHFWRATFPNLTLRQLLLVGIQLAEGLAHAHTEGRDEEGRPVVICDIKPENVAFRPNPDTPLGWDAVFIDLDLATHQGKTMGLYIDATPCYAAPGQVTENGIITPLVDQFALALTLRSVILRRSGFRKKGESEQDDIEILKRVARHEDPHIMDWFTNRQVPDPVRSAISQAMRWDPEDRFQDCGAFAEALRACMEHKHVIPYLDQPLG